LKTLQVGVALLHLQGLRDLVGVILNW